MPEPGNSQAWNRYSYVLGNPLKYVDPSGHLSINEVEAYFGYSSEEDMAAEWGTEVADLLWDSDFTWGDVLHYDGQNAMLVFREVTEGSGTYEGAFYGLAGEHYGIVVPRKVLAEAETVKVNTSLSKQYREDGYETLPKKWRSGYDVTGYAYYPGTYRDVGVANHAAAGGVGTTIWGGLARASLVAAPPPVVLTVGATLGFLGGVAVITDAYFGTDIMGNVYDDYPVIRPYRVGGYDTNTLHANPPAGHYQ